MKTNFTKGEWKQRKLFESPILVEDKENNREWLANTISISGDDDRTICNIEYATDTVNNGWGHNNTIATWEANAKLIAAAPELLTACINSAKTLISIGVTMEADIMIELENAIKKATE